jgi:hypothetical protein
MTALAGPAPRTLSNTETLVLPLNASTKVWDGSYLSNSSGKVVTLAGAFAGIALETRDPASGYSTIPVAVRGFIHEVAVTGASSASDISSTVYASDGNALTLTSTGGYAFGKITSFNPVTSKFTVSFQASTIA